ncbi:hypothetical protein B0T25DRAFT_252429 [Lasiosphaeria hispida]|uniref:Glycoside hydrolase family 125 protein n=1 Tax=Lasiosphaeria hispida TaxID=260671 RepID=A0AAJ0HFN9_9PEZI|nr:hypothetical protein B0T25DRAFT_252429 [Lasiosphaeria hispida]
MWTLWLLWLSSISRSSAKGVKSKPKVWSSQTTIVDDEIHCPDYSSFAYSNHTPASVGRFQLSYQRPAPACRTFNLSEVEETILTMKRTIRDPDLFRLFENCFPNTLDTAIAWRGKGDGEHGKKNEELTFITTGDINAMWLRDSANQLQSYRSLLRANTSSHSLASLFRGAINLQARYVAAHPHCNAFHAPSEADLALPFTSGMSDYITPSPEPSAVFECKYELDSLAAFLQLSHHYFVGTGDAAFFGKHRWLEAVGALMNATADLLGGTYNRDGSVAYSSYLFQRTTSSAYETLGNGGLGAPAREGTGMVRSAFRPSDDACTYQLFVPANMMFSRYLGLCADIVDKLGRRAMASSMRRFSASIKAGIEKYGRVNHRLYGKIYAYEVDGYGSHNAMDDANIPSLLSAPMFGYVDRNDPIYLNTRRFVLSKDNPYFMFGPVINSTGGPHVGPGMAWPMSLIVRILTTDDDAEIVDSLKQLLSSTNGLGLIHESINTHDETVWTRQWFSWANGLFGQMILDLRERKPYLLTLSYQ